MLYRESVRLGEWLIPSVNDCVYDGGECTDKVVDVGIEKRIPHPDYEPSCGLHDIALIRLDKDINYSGNTFAFYAENQHINYFYFSFHTTNMSPS